MENMEPLPACNQPRIPVVGFGNQLSNQIYGPDLPCLQDAMGQCWLRACGNDQPRTGLT